MRSRFSRALTFAVENSLLLIAGTAVALVWANVDPESYDTLVHPLHFVVNDIGMVFFFGLATKEIIEATAPGGPLHSVRRAAMPVLAAVGGMVGPAAVYLGLVSLFAVPEFARGWAIPCATDIAFSYLVARFVFGPEHPAVPFLLLLAIADDAFGLVILAVFYPTGEVRPLLAVALLGAACFVAWMMRRRNVGNFWPYLLIPGAMSWGGLYLGGLHPALALVPVLPFLPHASHDPGVYVEPARPQHDPLNEFEHWWQTPVEVVLFFFALVNAGVPFGSGGIGTWIVLIAIVVGKTLGITLASAVGSAAGLHLPSGLRWTDVLVVSLAAAIGFTVALFFATAAFPEGPQLEQAKLGALLSLGAAVLTPFVARILRVGRFRIA